MGGWVGGFNCKSIACGHDPELGRNGSKPAKKKIKKKINVQKKEENRTKNKKKNNNNNKKQIEPVNMNLKQKKILLSTPARRHFVRFLSLIFTEFYRVFFCLSYLYCRVKPRFIKCCRVLPSLGSLIFFYLVLPSLGSLLSLLPSFTEFYRVQGLSCLYYRVLPSLGSLLSLLPSFTEFYRV